MAVETLETKNKRNLVVAVGGRSSKGQLRCKICTTSDSVAHRLGPSTTDAGSGHPTSCASAAEIMSVLFYSLMRYDPRKSIHLINGKLNWARSWPRRSSLNSKRLRNHC